MSFPRYPKYKDSGVEWLGDVPEHWDATRFKFLGQAKIGLTYAPTDVVDDDLGDGTLVLRSSNVQGGRIVFDDNVFVNKDIPQALRTQEGDILICSRNGSRALIGKNAMIDSESAGMSFGAFMTIFRSELNRYLFWVFNSRLFELQSASFLTATINQLTVGNLNSFAVLLPPPAEQTAIAAFLDRETAKIDGLVAEQRRLMELLKEKRQAVISHAVTKGLNPDAPMKPSGIEWLGDVPEHWEMKRLGWICSEINDINHKMPKAVEDGVLFLSAKDLLNDGTLNFETDVKMISEEDYERLSQKIRPRRGDIIYSRIGAALGKARLVETDVRFNVSYSCCVVRIIEGLACRRFIRFLLDGEMILTEARMRTKGIGVPDLGLGEIARFPVPLPPFAEQEEIVAYMEEETRLLSEFLAEAQRAIDLLQERRTALISAAVTGQIDVRQLATAPEAA